MPGIRWSEQDSAETSAAIDWRWVAIVTATLFLNFTFCYEHGLDLAGFGPLALDVIIFALAAVLITLLFFLGPALAVRSTQRSVLSLLDDSIGSLPTLAVRLCCVAFLCLWIAKLVAVPTLWAMEFIVAGRFSHIMMPLFAVVLLSFLFLTAVQNSRIGAKLAMFADKLAIAILLAALIRVRDGWSSLPKGFSAIAGLYPQALQFTAGLSQFGAYAAPLGLLAAEYALRVPNRKQVALAVGIGVTLPMFLALSLSTIVGAATAASIYYQPSLNPTIAMALWSHAANSAIPPRMLVAGITTFGVLRFGFRSLVVYGPVNLPQKTKQLAGICSVIVIATLALHPFATASTAVMDVCEKGLAVTGAVLSADAVAKWKGAAVRPRFDLVGVMALAAGLGTAVSLPKQYVLAQSQWWLPWLLPSYAVAFFVSLAGRWFLLRRG